MYTDMSCMNYRVKQKSSITILPLPKFSEKWWISITDCPKNWEFIIRSSVIWSLAQQLRNRDRKNIEVVVQFINHNYFQNLQKKYESNDVILVFDGRLVCSSVGLFVQEGLYEHLIKVFAMATLRMMGVQDQQMLLRRVLGKYGLSE